MDDWEVIDSYTRKDALEDGFHVNVGQLGNALVDLTDTLIRELDKVELAMAIVKGLNEIQKYGVPSQVFIDVNGKEVIVASGYDPEEKKPVVTIMRPDDW